MKLQVWQIDAWREPDLTWRHNNSIHVKDVEINGEPTTRKILKALYDNGLLLKERAVGKFTVDDRDSFDGWWHVEYRTTGEPVFSLLETK